MLWAALVAVGVATVSMAILGARLTRKPHPEPQEDFVPVTDDDDPWAAWRPRPFEELDRPPRPRMWPVLAALTGLVLVGSGVAGARQAFQPAETVAADPTQQPYLIEVKVTPAPTPTPTPTPPPPTARPQAAAPKPAAAAAPAPATTGPQISGSATCQGTKIRLTYSVTPRDAGLTWVGVYFDGKVVRGGPVGSSSHSGGYETTATPGDHGFEVSAQDKAGKTSRRQWGVHCP